jgi:hypothetical protein
VTNLPRHAATLAVALLLVWTVPAAEDGSESLLWKRLADGLELARFDIGNPDSSDGSAVTVLRVDPKRYAFRLLSKAEIGVKAGLSVREWCEEYDLVAAINAGMYLKDYSTHVGYMKARQYINNPQIVRYDYHSAAAFGPLHDSLPLFRIYDLDEIEMDIVIASYESVVQNLRLIKRPRENRWRQKPDTIFSEVALAEDSTGRVLLIFSDLPRTMYDFNELLLSLPLGLHCAQYLEGGHEAQLCVTAGGLDFELSGRGRHRLWDSTDDLGAWPIPNAIGVVKRRE